MNRPQAAGTTRSGMSAGMDQVSSWSRDIRFVSGLILASSLVLANWVPAGQDTLVIAIMSVAFFGQGMTNLGWTVLTDLADQNRAAIKPR